MLANETGQMENRSPGTMGNGVEIIPPSPLMGAEITGLDLTEPFDDATFAFIHEAFQRYQLLCFRDQKLTKDQQVVFTEQFGTLERHTLKNRGSADHPRVPHRT